MPSSEPTTHDITKWQSIVTLIVFVVTNLLVLFPQQLYLPFPRSWRNGFLDALATCRIIEPRTRPSDSEENQADQTGWRRRFIVLRIPINFLTAPLIADLLLLAMTAIGRQEVHDGTVGSDNIFPIDIMAFFITLAYIAISIDASGLIRWLAFKVLQKGGSRGHWLYLYLYTFFFLMACAIGNDPVILSGTAFLAYMTRVSSNIKSPKAWIFTQFAVANIGSTVLVSSNPTNLVLAGAFKIKFITYTANVIVPVFITAILLFPFLLWIVFPYESLIPTSITLHELPQARKEKAPVNPNIPNARGTAEEAENADTEEAKLLSLEEVMNPFLDKKGAWAGAVIMAVTLVTILALNAATDSSKEHPVYWVTLPAAFVMLCWDLAFGWRHRKETREIARKGRKEVEEARRQRDAAPKRSSSEDDESHELTDLDRSKAAQQDKPVTATGVEAQPASSTSSPNPNSSAEDEKHATTAARPMTASTPRKETLVSMVRRSWRWFQETFPTTAAVLGHLPLPLVPFAFCMFVLVQGLVTKGWVPVFAYGWDHWVNKTGAVGAIGGMAFLSVIMCNFAGTNIGTAILLCRIVQKWVAIHEASGIPITERNFWATVYSLAIGLNFGAFSTAFSASLAGMLWRDILARKHIVVRASEFARVNFRIIAFTMVISCAVLVGQVWLTRGTSGYKSIS